MRSVYAKILLWGFGTLVVSLVAFFLITRAVSFGSARRGGPFFSMHAFQRDLARDAYEKSGKEGLRAFFQRMEDYFHADHHLTDAAGKDLLTGEDFSELLKDVAANQGHPQRYGERIGLVAATPDGKYSFVVMLPPPMPTSSFLPYYFLTFVVVLGLCTFLAKDLASPLRELARTVTRFGNGELNVRAKSKRGDEIGAVARSFDQMADRIQTLRTAERRLLQDISHELRSPLARLGFAVELARTSKDREASADRLQVEVDRLTALVGALLEVTRAEGDPESHRMEPVRLDTLLMDIAVDGQIEAEARGCRLKFEIEAEPEIRGDRELLHRAIDNIIRNAMRYAPQDTEVTLGVRVAEHEAILTVRDVGPGVPEEDLARLFTPFFRVDASRDTATGGVGLGLAIAHRAVTLHHGELSAENAQPGLRVTMRLPLAA